MKFEINCIALHCIVLQCIALHCIAAPLRTTPHRNAPHLTAPHRTAPHRTAPHRNAPHRTAPHRTASHRIASYRIASHRIASYRIVLYFQMYGSFSVWPSSFATFLLRVPIQTAMTMAMKKHCPNAYTIALHEYGQTYAELATTPLYVQEMHKPTKAVMLSDVHCVRLVHASTVAPPCEKLVIKVLSRLPQRVHNFYMTPMIKYEYKFIVTFHRTCSRLITFR